MESGDPESSDTFLIMKSTKNYVVWERKLHQKEKKIREILTQKKNTTYRLIKEV